MKIIIKFSPSRKPKEKAFSKIQNPNFVPKGGRHEDQPKTIADLFFRSPDATNRSDRLGRRRGPELPRSTYALFRDVGFVDTHGGWPLESFPPSPPRDCRGHNYARFLLADFPP